MREQLWALASYGPVGVDLFCTAVCSPMRISTPTGRAGRHCDQLRKKAKKRPNYRRPSKRKPTTRLNIDSEQKWARTDRVRGGKDHEKPTKTGLEVCRQAATARRHFAGESVPLLPPFIAHQNTRDNRHQQPKWQNQTPETTRTNTKEKCQSQN